MICHVYIETSLRWPKQGSGIVGIVFTDADDKHQRQQFGRVNDSSEHHSLLVGINRALDYLGGFDEVHLHLSSNIGYNFKWLERWKDSDFKNAKGEEIKHSEIWREIAEKINGKNLVVHTNEFNGYRNWLTNECLMRGRRHGFIP